MSAAVLVLWVAASAALAGYLLLFVATRRPVSLRLGRLALVPGSAAAVRLLLAACGDDWHQGLDMGLTVLAGVGAVGLAAGRRCWLVRTSGEEFREQLRRACGGLFLALEEPAQGLLVVKGESRLRLVGLARRVQGLVLCPRPEKGKVRLLLDWLAKQYPGPVPRVRITLRRDDS
jgi:hypothetical protein